MDTPLEDQVASILEAQEATIRVRVRSKEKRYVNNNNYVLFKNAKGGTSDQSRASELTYSSLIRLQVEGDQENQESQCQVGVFKHQF